MENVVVRRAVAGDNAFLVEAIISAEKSNTSRLGLATLFGSTEEEVRVLVERMLEEEVDGCEFSTSSFLVAEVDGKAVAAVAGWIEGAGEDEMQSTLLKANLIGYTFPAERIQELRTNATVITGIQIPREKDSLQIEYVHVDPAHRGKGLAGRLISAHLAAAAGAAKAQVQAFADNAVAIGLYERLGFRIVRTFASSDPRTILFMPYTEKVLMERDIDQDHGT
ncbi:MAG: GNAT family N-acetyltransferase [Flavobacteriales bacterium]|nr:GNAT family N-acetyltransferase [Flavobacteriales bacterium]